MTTEGVALVEVSSVDVVVGNGTGSVSVLVGISIAVVPAGVGSIEAGVGIASCLEDVSTREEAEGGLVEVAGAVEIPLGVINCKGTCPFSSS